MFLPSSCSNRHHHRHQHHPWRPDLSSQWMSSDVKPPLYSYRTSASIEEWYQSLFINRTTSLAGDKGSCWHAPDQRRPLRRSGYLMWCLECDAREIGLGVRYKGHGQISYCSRDFIYGIMVHQKEKRKKRDTHTHILTKRDNCITARVHISQQFGSTTNERLIAKFTTWI